MAYEEIIKLSKDLITLSETIFQTILLDPKTEEFILNLIRQDQLFDQGINSLGVKLDTIGGDYSNATIEGTSNFSGKKELGLPFDRITLFNTGDFYESFEINASKEQALFDANYIKDGVDLRERWGRNIVDLTEQNRQKVINVFEELTIKAVEEVANRAA